MLSTQGRPIGLREESAAIDQGTIARTASPLPGPIGLQAGLGIFLQVKSTVPRLKSRGITVHAESQISAQDWVKKIHDSKHIPEHYQKQIKSKGDAIFVKNPLKFKVPNDVIQKDWRTDWLSVFVKGGAANKDWEMTTGCLDFTVKKGDSSGPFITVTHSPDLSKGESVGSYTKYTMTAKSRSTTSIKVERGNTLPTGVNLKSGRKLIVIANRIALKLGSKVKMFTFEDDELVEVWFHETACHAGRNSQGLLDVHGDKVVDRCARDIEDMFPKTTTVPKVLTAIQNFLKP